MDKVKEETKCEFYNNYECNAYYDIYPEPEDCQRDLCRTHEDCYYRQLKRLEQENETFERTNNELRKRFSEDTTKLSAELKELQGKYNGLNANYNSLKTELQRLKARLRPLEDSYFKGLSSIQITELAKKSIRITAENRKLEYALQEIREYCENQNLKADYTACEILDILTKAEEE